MKIVDNVMGSQYQDHLEEVMTSSDFPYYLNARTASYEAEGCYKTELTKDEPQFTHTFVRETFPTSGFLPLIQPLIDMTAALIGGEYQLHQCKANLNGQSADYKKKNYYVPHVDYNEPGFMTAIYYVADSDGDTLFFNAELKVVERVTPKKGRLVYFDASRIHAGQAPMQYKHRCLINFNFCECED